MRKFFLIVFFVIISFFVPLQGSFAQEMGVNQPLDSQQSVLSTQAAIIKYDLAYPGILPDNPLYKLKVLRDRIEAGLITDPMKKISFYLLQTDKGISATAILIDKKNIPLANQTALKAENNYTLLTYEVKKLPKKLDASTYKRLKDASLKHQEVLTYLMGRISKDDAQTFQTVISFSKRNWQSIDDYQKFQSDFQEKP